VLAALVHAGLVHPVDFFQQRIHELHPFLLGEEEFDTETQRDREKKRQEAKRKQRRGKEEETKASTDSRDSGITQIRREGEEEEEQQGEQQGEQQEEHQEISLEEAPSGKP
jgi:hypothetical protein